MSIRITRSMKRQAELVALGCPDRSRPPFKKKKLAVADAFLFGNLPAELKEQILSFLPIPSISRLCLASREMQIFIEDWITTRRALRMIFPFLSYYKPGVNLFPQPDNFRLMCSDLGELIRAATILKSNGPADRVTWVRNVMTELKLHWRSHDSILSGFGAFLDSCFKFSSEEEVKSVVKTVLGKLRMKIYLRTQLKYLPGTKINHEVRTRIILRNIFPSNYLLLAAVRFLATPLPVNHIARFIFVLYGPLNRDFGNMHIDWLMLSEFHPPKNAFSSLGKFLNLKIWRAEPFSAGAIIRSLLDKSTAEWSPDCLGALFMVLDCGLSIPYMVEEKSRTPQILISVGKISEDRMMSSIDCLRDVMDKEPFKKILDTMEDLITENIIFQRITCKETCQDCTYCSVCPMGKLEKIASNISEAQNKKLKVKKPSAPTRWSLRQRRQCL